MANGKIRFGKQSGGELALVIPDGVDNTEVVVPESGILATEDYADLKQSKSELAYDANTSRYIPNTLASGAIIERGSNANGEYIKYVDGTLICMLRSSVYNTVAMTQTGSVYFNGYVWTFPHSFANATIPIVTSIGRDGTSTGAACWGGTVEADTSTTTVELRFWGGTSTSYSYVNGFAIGRWK